MQEIGKKCAKSELPWRWFDRYTVKEKKRRKDNFGHLCRLPTNGFRFSKSSTIHWFKKIAATSRKPKCTWNSKLAHGLSLYGPLSSQPFSAGCHGNRNWRPIWKVAWWARVSCRPSRIGLVSKYLGTRSLAGLRATSGQGLPRTCEFRYRFIVFRYFFTFRNPLSRPSSMFKVPRLLLVFRKVALMFFVCFSFSFFFNPKRLFTVLGRPLGMSALGSYKLSVRPGALLLKTQGYVSISSNLAV